MKKFKLPIATLILSSILLLFYFVLSGGRSYITPLSVMYPLGVSHTNLIGALTYTFTHIGIKHLIGNLVAMIVFGSILEQYLDKWHAAAIFLISGIFGGAVYAFMHPEVWVVGASAAIAGVLAASIITTPKKTLIAFAIVMFLVPNLVLPTTDAVLDKLETIKTENVADTQETLEQIVIDIEESNYTEEVLEEKIQEKQTVESEYTTAIEEKKSLTQGRDTEEATPASWKIHLLGAFFALGFMVIFDRDILEKQGRRLLAIVES